jgi:regulator of protease activity HflC (stomatin/prohibitin superfamily)
MLENAAYREMVRYCASATLDTTQSGSADRPQAIMTSGWDDASKALQGRIAQAVGPDGLDLGVDVASVRLTAVHPPASAAEDFEAVLAAERNQDRLRYEAEGAANKTLANVAGDPDSALELAMAIRRVEQLDSLANLRQRPAQFDQYLRGYVRQCVESLKLLRKEIIREGLLGRAAATSAAASERGGFARLLRQRMDATDKDMRALIEQIADWPMLDELGPGGSPKQHLAARQAGNLLELLAILGEGTKFDFGPALSAAHSQADAMFARAAGDPARLVAEAGSDKTRREMAERTRAERFQRELDAWKASPNMYVLDRRLDVWDEVLPGMLKYVIGVDPGKIEVWMNWEQESRGLEGAFGGAGGNK